MTLLFISAMCGFAVAVAILAIGAIPLRCTNTGPASNAHGITSRFVAERREPPGFRRDIPGGSPRSATNMRPKQGSYFVSVATVGEGVAHGVGGIAVLIGMAYVVPWFNQGFAELFGVEPPAFTLLLMETARIVAAYPHFTIPSLAFALAVDIVFFWALHHNPQSKFAARLFSASITGVLALVIVVSMLGILVPFINVWRAL